MGRIIRHNSTYELRAISGLKPEPPACSPTTHVSRSRSELPTFHEAFKYLIGDPTSPINTAGFPTLSSLCQYQTRIHNNLVFILNAFKCQILAWNIWKYNPVHTKRILRAKYMNVLILLTEWIKMSVLQTKSTSLVFHAGCMKMLTINFTLNGQIFHSKCQKYKNVPSHRTYGKFALQTRG
jgi:hypothetical protein